MSGGFSFPQRESCGSWEGREPRPIVPISCDAARHPLPVNELAETWNFDVQASWDSPWNARLTAGIRNVFDEDPPVSFSTFAGSFDPSYEVPGRFWYLRYRQTF